MALPSVQVVFLDTINSLNLTFPSVYSAPEWSWEMQLSEKNMINKAAVALHTETGLFEMLTYLKSLNNLISTVFIFIFAVKWKYME